MMSSAKLFCGHVADVFILIGQRCHVSRSFSRSLSLFALLSVPIASNRAFNTSVCMACLDFLIDILSLVWSSFSCFWE